MDPLYAVREARLAVLARYGLDKEAGLRDVGQKAVNGAEWLFSRHPNTHTYRAWDVKGHQPGQPGLWDKLVGRPFGKGAPVYGMVDKNGRGPGAWNYVKDMAHHVGEFGRDWNFGSPVDMAREMRDTYRNSGSAARAVGEQIRNHYWHPQADPLSKALSTGLTGYELYNAVNGDEAHRKGDISAAATSAAIAPFTGRMGSIIGMPLHMAATNAARSVGHRFDADPTQSHFQAPYDVSGHTRRWLRTNPLGAAASAVPDPSGGFSPGDIPFPTG